MTQTICLNMIVKNESHLIENTLIHLLEKIKFTYWVICDTGSTDNTMTIIQEFFDKMKIPGELYSNEWKNFAHNRTLALEYAFEKTDYLLIFDADDSIVGDLVIPDKLKADAYNFQFGLLIKYQRPLLINNRKKWIFESVIHEYLKPLESVVYSNLEGNYYVNSGRTGNRNKDPDKYLKDALILKDAFYEAESQNLPIKNRYAFYCANSYFDYKNFADSVEWYKKVLTLDNWDQEKYVSCIRLGIAYQNINEIEKFVFYMLQSFEYDCKRLEGIYYIILYYISKSQYKIAYHYYKFIENYYENEYCNDKAIDNKVFIENHIYRFNLPYIMTNVAENLKDIELQFKMIILIFMQNYTPPIAQMAFNILDMFEKLKTKIDIPEECVIYYQSYKLLIEKTFNRPKKIETKLSNKILFYTGFCPQEWNKTQSLEKGLGGSERAVIYLAECFPKNYEIFISGQVIDEKIDNITFISHDQLPKLIHENHFDTVIVSRYISFFENYPDTKTNRIIVWSHDIDLINYGSSIPTREILQKNDFKINHYVFLTTWHKNLMIQKYPWIQSKSVIINNGIINIQEFSKTKIPNSFVYSSCTERGLVRLLELWPQIIEKIPDASLKICSYNSFPKNEEEIILKKIVDQYTSISHVGCLSAERLYTLMQQSEFWLYPSYWPETSCITAMEMLKCKVVCLYYPVAGLPETINNIGIEISPNDEIEKLISVTEPIKTELIQKGTEYTKNCLWKDRFEQWKNILNLNSVLPKKNVIAFSLWGDKKMYTIGAIRNAKLALEIYPGFECWFYVCSKTVPKEIINELENFSHVKIVYKNDSKPMMWRFEAVEDKNVDILLVRDTDSRLNSREQMAVKQWVQSDKTFHIMRDHPHHTVPILGGMWGIRNSKFSWKSFMDKIEQIGDKGYDQVFLEKYIYPLVKENSMIHANFYKLESNTYNFPIEYDENFHFVGEVYDENDIRIMEHVKILEQAFFE